MTLRYPSSAGAAGSDYVSFTPVKYQSNEKGGPPPSNGAAAIVLYMPNSTPAVDYANSWGELTLRGPLGSAQKKLGQSLAMGVMGLGGSGSISGYIKDTMAPFQGTTGGQIADAAKQKALQAIPQDFMGGTPNQMLALAKGEVFNPNVELTYSQPGFRQFAMNFDFLPRNLQEANMMNQIIKTFKSRSAPADIGNGMFEVPDVWNIKYMTGAEENRYMNKFKPAACIGVNVQANQVSDMHVSTIEGVPIQTTLSLLFKEVDIVIRKDHESAPQGF